ncbi:MAG: hypothetical protein LUF26_07525 [Firmicutes bacterium]|nr:hypothetical protein [Bacillota bacterium]
MATVKKKKILMYKGKPLLRCGDRIYYGNLEDKCILALDIVDSKPNKDIKSSTKIKVQVMDNTGEFGKGQVYRKGERENLYKAIDIGEWWLKDALQMMG